MRDLNELARQRLTLWRKANHAITQATIAKAVGVTQGWVSKYERGEQDADVDQLDAMARVYNHTLYELFDVRPDPKERALVEAYRRLRPDARALALHMIEAMSPPVPERGRTRRRSDE